MSEHDFNSTGTLTFAFQSLTKSLGLGEYPCISLKRNDKVIKFNNGKKFVIKEYDDYQTEKDELLHLIKDKKSPWFMNYDWSTDANSIREQYLSEPGSIDPKNIEKHFNNLRIVDKNITEIDKGLLKFVNLKELILNSNLIENADSANLPQSLKSLDLSGNQINDLNSLVKCPIRGLEHLSLSFNHIIDLNDYFHPSYWPSLLSLDLSGNHLKNLTLVVNKLKLLPNLRNLLLYGNPLNLIPSYRGFVVDTLSNLNYLDDQSISKDERFRYFNMRLYPDFVKNETEVTINVKSLKNIYAPIEIRHPENLPEFPVIIYKYYVTISYVEDIEYENLKVKSAEQTEETQVCEQPIPYNDVLRDRFTEHKTYKTKILSTQMMDFSDNMQFNEKGIIKTPHSALKALRDYINHGMEIKIIEQKLTYDEIPEKEGDSTSQIGSKGKKDTKKSDKDKDKKDKKPIDMKKKKDINAFLSDLKLTSTEENFLATFNYSLSSILEGNNFKLENTFKKELEIPEYVKNEFNGGLDTTTNSKNKDKKGKDAKLADPKKSAKPPSAKDKAKGKKPTEATIEEVQELKANILELNFSFEILNFKNFDDFRSYSNINPITSSTGQI